MLRESIFRIGYLVKRPPVIHYHNDFQKTEWQSFESLRNQQEKQLRELIKFAYENVPYYTRLFNQRGIGPNKTISTIEDLEKLPILTKRIIKENWHDFVPRNISKLKYTNGSTGGSTGEPLRYRMSLEDYERGIALLYRGWGYAGYKLGEKVAIIAGSSLIPTTMTGLRKKIVGFLRNADYYSSFEMSEQNLFRYFQSINKRNPRLIRGYASSIYIFARFIRDNDLKLEFQPKGVFTTADKLFNNQRTLIEEVIGAPVFDSYSLNDGGVSAIECQDHCGMHTDTERAILEVVDEHGKQTTSKQGKILATSLYNYALPFIRYDTGDLGIISDIKCSCGRSSPLLIELVGRVTDFLKLNNIIIGSPVLTVLMGKFDIEQYQIIQDSPSSIICRIIKGNTYDKKRDEGYITESFYSHVGKINVAFEYVHSIPTTEAGKYKFIINNLEEVVSETCKELN